MTKKGIACILAFLLCLLTVTACSSNGTAPANNENTVNNNSSKIAALNARNIQQLADENGFVYGVGIFDVFAFKFNSNGTLSGCDVSSSDLSPDYDDLADSSCSYTIWDDSNWSLSQDWGGTYTFRLEHAGTNYVIFSESSAFTVLMNKKTMQNLKEKQSDFTKAMPTELQALITLMDSCS